MNWDALFGPWKEWEGRFDDWKRTQPAWGGVIGCLEYNRRNGDLQGWAEQAQENKRIEDALRGQFAELDPPPAVEFTDIAG